MRLRRELSRLRDGGAAVYAPEITTGQTAKSELMRAVRDRLGAGAGRCFTAADYYIWYRASSGAEPDADDPAWTKHEYSPVTVSVAGGVLHVSAP